MSTSKTTSKRLRLFGLPFKANNDTVKEFVVSNLKNAENAKLANYSIEVEKVQLGAKKPKKNGPKRGEAWVDLVMLLSSSEGTGEQGSSSLEDVADDVVKALDRKHMEDRFIEVSWLDVDNGCDKVDKKEVEVEQAGKEQADEPLSKKRKIGAANDVEDAESPASEQSTAAAASPSSSSEVATSRSTSRGTENLALRLFGLPFTATAAEVKEFLVTNSIEEETSTSSASSNKSIAENLDADGDIWIGTTPKWELQDVAPCKGEAWVYKYVEKVDSTCAEESTLKSTLTSAFHNKQLGKRYLEISFVDVTTGETIWYATDPAKAKEQQKGKGKDGKGAKGAKGKGKDGSVDSSKGNRELFVRFLPYEADSDDVSNFFSSAGEIERVKLYQKAGLGFITFKSEEAARNAVIEFDNAPWNSRRLRVCLSSEKDSDKDKKNQAETENTEEDRTKLFFQGLPFDCTVKDIKALMDVDEEAKTSVAVELLVEKERHKFLGKALAKFETTKEAEEALKRLNQQEKLLIRNRLVRVAFVRNKNATADHSGKGKGKKQKVYYHQLFMKFLPLEAAEDDIKKWCAENDIFYEDQDSSASTERPDFQSSGRSGCLRRIKLCKDADGYSKGIGFLFFDTEEAATQGVESLNGAEFWDKHVEVTWATGR
ncbi:unnamed protein product [Amoebophrya sp. A25]|nr:unnamed protein product [Amoebophrya sp. A25]|eukprot:GSA25T00001673001.1